MGARLGSVSAASLPVAVVTGGGHGIGRASAERLAGDGYAVAIAEIDAERGRLAAAAIVERGGVATSTETDVSDAASVEAMVAGVMERGGWTCWSTTRESGMRGGCMSWRWTTGIG